MTCFIEHCNKNVKECIGSRSSDRSSQNIYNINLKEEAQVYTSTGYL
jgi:hypothetical protein